MKGKERYVLPLITFTLVLIAWQAAASLGIWEDYLFPSPLAVAGGILETALNGVLWQHIGISLFRFFTGYLIAAAVAVPLGLIAGWYRNLWVAIDPLVQVLRPISPIAWMPLIALWFGIGNLPAIVIIFLAAFYPMLLSTVAAVKNVDPVYLKVAQNFGTSEKDILRKVVVPAVFPYIMMGMHIALGTAWVFLVAGEMMGVRSGLGFLIVDARNSMRTELVLTGMVIIGVLGLTLDRSIGYLEQRVKKRWGFSA
ncbi:ABC transporter permease [Metallumcola ferriviriculae]|uniref:ABC transporter permease n=1 Tax=Metallumcola ferriviriculae TaxID=3039180 RepID=A0AAU0UMV4_9FIRM|nr:ABC transporter permease [Desulfitibacteraceae bacterium MK1]